MMENGTEQSTALAVVEVSSRYEVAIEALVSGKSVTEAAKAAGYRRETLSRLRHKNPVFRAAFNRRQREAHDAVINDLRALIGDITERVRAALNHPELSPAAVVQSGLSALPKLYALAQAQEIGLTDDDEIARSSISSSFETMLKLSDGIDDDDVKRVIGAAQKELDNV
jgi:hypothetical protein